MRQFRSIVAQILWLHVLAVGSVAVLVTLSLYFLLVLETTALQRDAMRRHADRIAEHLSIGADGEWRLDLPEDIQDRFSQAYDRYVYAVVDDAGRVLFASHPRSRPIFPDDPESSSTTFRQIDRGQTIVSGVRIPKTRGGRTVFVEAAENLSHRDVLLDDVVANFVPRVGWITVPILILFLFINAQIVARAFRPILDASRKASEVGPARTDIRLSLDEVPSEIAPLVIAVNGALDRLEKGFRVQREFTADAAHELRTPITILRTRVDTLGDPRVAEALRHDLESMTRVVAQLLDIADVEGMVLDEAERADLRAVAAEVIGYLAPLALAQDKDIALVGVERPVQVIGNGEMIERAIRNLVENAIRHTAPLTTVEVDVDPDGVVHVRDQGPGIGPEERPMLFQRFWRRDRKHAGGAGLGLSIVKGIMELHGGSVVVADRPGGGAQFSLRFRLPPDAPRDVGNEAGSDRQPLRAA